MLEFANDAHQQSSSAQATAAAPAAPETPTMKDKPTLEGQGRSPHFAASQMVLRGSAVQIAERKAFLKVEPRRCRMWAHHDRDPVWYTEESCADVIASIRKNGQQEAAVARKLEGDPQFDYEIVIGGRRRFACEVLGMPLQIEIKQLSDAEAAVLMHIENSDRKDISPMEKAQSYARHLKAGLFGNQELLAEAINRSPGQVTKMIRAASLMEVPQVRRLISDVRTVSIEDAYRVASLLEADATRGIVLKAADQMARSGSHEGKNSSAVLKLLAAAPTRSALSSALKKDYNVGKQGKLVVTRNSKGKVTFAFPKGITPSNREEVIAAIREVVEDLTK